MIVNQEEYYNCLILDVGIYYSIQHLKTNEVLHAINKTEAWKIARLMEMSYKIAQIHESTE